MPFNTYTFIIFFILIFCLYAFLKDWKHKKLTLLISSYLFYSAWNPIFVLLLLFSTCCDWYLAKIIYRTKNKKWKFNFLFLSLLINLGLLGYFKYGEFILSNVLLFVENWGIYFQPLPNDIVLPVGISFYTFQTLSYSIDVYRNKISPADSFLNYALYVSFFPQLVAGPIVRAGEFLPQCKTPREISENKIGWGLSLMVIGLFMKIILADIVFAPIVNNVYETPSLSSSLETWVAIFSFSGQIFCDFGGYSICAIGVALCFGFVLPQNFNAPYAALGFQDFWKRWHISLSTWFRDYLYISLGGNKGTDVKTAVNLLFTMVVAGLWHGASWMFVFWGGLHGIYLILEKNIKKYILINVKTSIFSNIIIMLCTYIIVSITWVFFRANDLSQAKQILYNLFINGNANETSFNDLSSAIILSVSLLVWHIYRRNKSLETIFSSLSATSRALLLFTQLLLIILFGSGDDSSFIYFQF